MKIPESLMPLLNPFVSWLLRSPIHRVTSKNVMLITFTGRRTGKQYTTPVSYYQEGNTVRCFTHSAWARNLRGGAQVTLRLRGQGRLGNAEAITDDAKRMADALRTFLTRVPRDAPYYDVSRDSGGQLELSDLGNAIQGVALVEIRLA